MAGLGDPDWKPDNQYEWTYKREEGDIVVFAETKEEALLTIRQHGFLVTDPTKCVKTGGSLAEILKEKKEAIK